MSVGIENISDIMADVAQVLASSFSSFHFRANGEHLEMF
jgi:hypothetical protein